MTKGTFQQENSFHQQIELQGNEETSRVLKL